MIQPRIVLLGTGTDVGKTFVGSWLAAALRNHRPVVALKPIESGLGPAVSDAERLAPGPGDSVGARRHAYGFPEPISPHLAAERAGVTICLESLIDWVAREERAALPESSEVIGCDMTTHVMSQPISLIESAGGVFSPLAPGVTNFDLARALEPSHWVLVAPDALGVLHDVTATLEAMTARGRRPDVVVTCAARTADASTGTNRAELERLGITTVLAGADRDDASGLEPLLDWALGLSAT